MPQGSGWIGRWVSHALPHARRPRVTGTQGADTELVRSEKRPLAAAKTPLTSLSTGPLSVAAPMAVAGEAAMQAVGSAGLGGRGSAANFAMRTK